MSHSILVKLMMLFLSYFSFLLFLYVGNINTKSVSECRNTTCCFGYRLKQVLIEMLSLTTYIERVQCLYSILFVLCV